MDDWKTSYAAFLASARIFENAQLHKKEIESITGAFVEPTDRQFILYGSVYYLYQNAKREWCMAHPMGWMRCKTLETAESALYNYMQECEGIK